MGDPQDIAPRGS